jgi:hypothetical protein
VQINYKSGFILQKKRADIPTALSKTSVLENIEYSRTPIIRINSDGEPSGYAENPDNWIFV